MAKFITFGCSFLSMSDPSKNESSWPGWLEHDYGHKWEGNFAYSAGGNDIISRGIIQNLNYLRSMKNVKVLIQWSFVDRIEFLISKKESPLWDKLVDRNKVDFNPESLINDPDSGWLKTGGINGSWFANDEIEKFASHYYKHYHTYEERLINTLERILLIQNLLEKNNIQYRMLCVHAFDAERAQFKNSHAVSSLINWGGFIRYGQYGGMYEWVKENTKDLLETNHPSSFSHREFLHKFLYNKIERFLNEN